MHLGEGKSVRGGKTTYESPENRIRHCLTPFVNTNSDRSFHGVFCAITEGISTYESKRRSIVIFFGVGRERGVHACSHPPISKFLHRLSEHKTPSTSELDKRGCHSEGIVTQVLQAGVRGLYSTVVGTRYCGLCCYEGLSETHIIPCLLTHVIFFTKPRS